MNLNINFTNSTPKMDNNNCSISSETQSMSVRSIKDPTTGELIMPTEAIKRRLLDPYKGLFCHPMTKETMPISEAIQKGFVIVEILHNQSQPTAVSQNENINNNNNIISTSLIRETKSYHLLGVYDPSTNDEISIKEAIQRGILDRKKGLYVHPITKESFSISDAINKNVIRAKILNNPSVSAMSSNLPYQTLVSSNRFEENITYTICGAIDPRTNKKVSLSQAIRDGIIDAKNGTYINITTGEAIPINKAIECRLVLTETDSNNNKTSKPTAPINNREIKTLNIECVKDPRTGKFVSVLEAMHAGLLDRQSLNFYNPLTNENLSLNKAFEHGFIIGHYTDTNVSTSNFLHIEEHNNKKEENESYFINSIYDPKFKRHVSLDQAISMGIFEQNKAIYIHPITHEHISIGEAVSKGFINAETVSNNGVKINMTNRYDPRLPVGDFNIDKKIKSMRTKFNKDGTSVLQIDIESTKPTKGVYEVDVIEEFTPVHKDNSKSVTSTVTNVINSVPVTSTTSREFRQVVDINSVHRVNNQHLIQIHQEPIHNVHAEKNIVRVEINKEIGSDLKMAKRIEDVVEDDVEPLPPHSATIRIQVDNNNNKNIYKEEEKLETLIINDINDSKIKNKFLNIDGQTHRINNELQINEPITNTVVINNVNRTDFNRKVTQFESELNKREKVGCHEIYEESHLIIKKMHPFKESINIENDDNRKVQHEKVLVIEETSTRKPPASSLTIVDEIVKQAEEEEESFDEWTEIYTITIRGVRYKILWVYDPLKTERVTLTEATKRGIINLKNNIYHHLKDSTSFSINEAVQQNLIGIEEDNSALTLKVNGITYVIYWVWDPVKKKRISPKRAIDRGVLDLKNLLYRNYSNNETISIHEAVYMKLIGASDDLSFVEEELCLDINNYTYKIAWVKDSRTGEKYKPRDALRHGLLDLTNYFYNKYDTNESLSIKEAIDQGFIGISDKQNKSNNRSDEDDDDYDFEMNRQDSLMSLDDEELTIKTKTAIYVITGLLHPETQKEIKVSEAINSGILDKQNGSYRDFKTNVTYEVGEAINEGIVFATVTDLLSDESASTEFTREEVKRFIVKSVLDPRTNERIGGLQAQAAGILNYAQGVYTNPDDNKQIPISDAISRGLIEVTLQEETSREEFDAEVVTDTLLERRITNYRITGVIDPFSNELISASDAVHRQIIDTETNAYVDSSSTSEPIPIKEAVRRNLIQAEVTERIERKPLGLTLQNAIRLGLFNPDLGKFKDPYTNQFYDLNQAIEKGHINSNGAALTDSSSGTMTLNEAFNYNIFNRRNGILDRTRMNMFKAKIVESKIYKWNLEDAVKCGIVNLKTGKYKHQQSGEILSLKEAITRGLIDGESTIVENPLTGVLMTLKQTLDTVKIDEQNGNVYDLTTNKLITSLEQAFNTRKIFSAFNENTGEIFLASIGKIVPFEKAMRKNKLDKSVKVFDPKSNKDFTLNDAIERTILDKTSGMVIDPKGGGGLLSIKEAVKRGIISITGAPLVTGHHNSETIEVPQITSRKRRHALQKFEDINERSTVTTKKNTENVEKSNKNKTKIIYDNEYLSSSLLKDNPEFFNSNDNTITSVKVSNEEHRKRINNNNVIESIKGDYKETVLKPGEIPTVTSYSNYEKEIKTKLNDLTIGNNSNSNGNNTNNNNSINN